MQLEGSHRQVEGSLGSSWLELAPGTGTLSSDSNSFLLPLSWILTRECLRTVEGGAGKRRYLQSGGIGRGQAGSS